MNQPKMTCEFTRVVHINFRGYRMPEDEGTMRVPRDDGMVAKILKFMMDEDLYPATRGGVSGGGRYIASFFEDDAEKIVKFLADQGVECTRIVKEAGDAETGEGSQEDTSGAV